MPNFDPLTYIICLDLMARDIMVIQNTDDCVGKFSQRIISSLFYCISFNDVNTKTFSLFFTINAHTQQYDEDR